MSFIHDELPARDEGCAAAVSYVRGARSRSSTITATFLRKTSPRIAGSRNLFEIWLEGDHYKWRAMRASGVPERYCTATPTPHEKFLAWAKTVPLTLRNPLYHWTHLELKRYFGIDELLDERTADSVWARANEQLKSPQLSAKGILGKFCVKAVCTTDDPADPLTYHEADRRVRSADEGLSDVPRRSRDGSASAGRLQSVGRQAGGDGERPHRAVRRICSTRCASAIRRFTTSAAGCPITASISATRPTAPTRRRSRSSRKRAPATPRRRRNARRSPPT